MKKDLTTVWNYYMAMETTQNVQLKLSNVQFKFVHLHYVLVYSDAVLLHTTLYSVLCSSILTHSVLLDNSTLHNSVRLASMHVSLYHAFNNGHFHWANLKSYINSGCQIYKLKMYYIALSSNRIYFIPFNSILHLCLSCSVPFYLILLHSSVPSVLLHFGLLC